MTGDCHLALCDVKKRTESIVLQIGPLGQMSFQFLDRRRDSWIETDRRERVLTFAVVRAPDDFAIIVMTLPSALGGDDHGWGKFEDVCQ